MQQRKAKFSGVITYWSLSEQLDLAALKAGWEGLGLAAYVPHGQTPDAALKAALVKTCGGLRRLVRPLKQGGYALVDEDADDQTVRHAVTVTVKVDESTGALLFEPAGYGDHAQVMAEYQHQRGLCPSRPVAQGLSKLLDSLSAVPLKWTGGIYWLPEDRLATWQAAVDVVERAGQGKCSVYVLRTAVDDQAIRAVTDALTEEIEGELARLEAEVMGGELKAIGLQNRAQQASLLGAKVATYEGLLDVTLEELKQAAERLQAAAATAALAALAGSDDAAA